VTARTLVRRRGRPPKYARPSRPVTVTLPIDVVAALRAVDHDLGRAIVRLAERRAPLRAHPAAELAVFGRRAVIVVRRTAALKARAGVDLVPMPDGRALIAFDRATTTAAVALKIADALADESLAPADRLVFESIASILHKARRSKGIDLVQRNIIVLEARGAERLA
jgi:hypothetical protein